MQVALNDIPAGIFEQVIFSPAEFICNGLNSSQYLKSTQKNVMLFHKEATFFTNMQEHIYFSLNSTEDIFIDTFMEYVPWEECEIFFLMTSLPLLSEKKVQNNCKCSRV